MGIIDEGKDRIAEAERQRLEALNRGKEQVIDGIMGELKPILDEPIFTGDVETALVHYMGRDAFEDEAITERYTELVERIEANNCETGEFTPVLLIHQLYDSSDDSLNNRSFTALLKVEHGDVRFISKRSVKQGVPMHAFTRDVADVTHSTLAIVADSYAFDDSILTSNKPLRPYSFKGDDPSTNFSLSECHVAEGNHGSDIPSEYAFSDRSIERLYGDPIILVGWDEIGRELEKTIRKSPAADEKSEYTVMLKDALKIKSFLEGTDCLDVARERVPRLAAIIEAADTFLIAVGKLTLTVSNDQAPESSE